MPHSLTETETTPVQTIELGVNDRLNRAAQRLVKDKFLVDKSVAEHGAHMLARDLHDGGYGPHEPLPFLRLVLPFFFAITEVPGRQPALVPTANTLGCCWRWRGTDFADEQVQSLIGKLSDVSGLLDKSLDLASYAWIKELGLLAPMEGKNRVDFLRGQGIDLIPAYVSERSYPSPERIKIYLIQISSFTETWAVLDGRWVEKVENPSWTLPMMEAYGVKTSAVWPADFPEPELVVQTLFGYSGTNTALGHPDFPNEVVVDLETLGVATSFNRSELSCIALQLNSARIDPRLWLFSAALALASGLALILAPTNWDDFKLGAAMAFGAAISAALLPSLVPFMRTQRKHIGNLHSLPLELSPKHHGRRDRRDRRLG